MNFFVLAWAISSTLGALFSAYAAFDSGSDVASVKREGNGRLLIAGADLRREVIRVVIFGMWALVGWLVMFELLAGALVVASLVIGNVLLVANSFLDVRSRHLIEKSHHVAELLDEEPGDELHGV